MLTKIHMCLARRYRFHDHFRYCLDYLSSSSTAMIPKPKFPIGSCLINRTCIILKKRRYGLCMYVYNPYTEFWTKILLKIGFVEDPINKFLNNL